MRRPFFYVKGYDGAAGVALGDRSGHCIGTLFFHSLFLLWDSGSSRVLMWDWFVLGTRTFREGGVMMRWLWPLGRVWAPAIMPLHCFVFCMVVSLGFCTVIHLQYIVWFKCEHYCMLVFVVIMWRTL